MADTATTGTAAAAQTNEPLIRVEGLRKSFGSLEVLKGIDLSVNPGEVVTIIGASGSGKSTFLNLIGGLEDADAGSIMVDGCDLTVLKPTDLGVYRRRELGFVFQFYNLVPDLTIKEIATKLNFPTQSFFGKYFKQYVGVSPKEYRNKQIRQLPF